MMICDTVTWLEETGSISLCSPNSTYKKMVVSVDEELKGDTVLLSLILFGELSRWSWERNITV
jgi:hypothetical protein